MRRSTPTLFDPRDLAVFRSVATRSERYRPVATRFVVGTSLDDEQQMDACRAWAWRAAGEARALEFNQKFLRACERIGMPEELCAAVRRITRDESRHVALCEDLCRSFGDYSGELPPALGHRMPDPDACASLADLTRWGVTMYCLGEVCAVGQIRANLESECDPVARAVTRSIYRDEVQHERFGWVLARRLLPALRESEREDLAAAFAHSLAFYETCHVGIVGGSEADGSYAEAFYSAVEGTVLPRLAAAGLPAWEAWSLRVEAAGTWGDVPGVV